MKIHYLQHVPFEGLGSIAPWAARGNHAVSVTRLYQDDPLPPLTAIDGLIVLGGPMNIYQDDQYPWLISEKRLIAQAIEEGKTVIGICLGAQLIADVLGAKVYPGKEKEIGWFPIAKTRESSRSTVFDDVPPQLTVFHWHGDTFDLPPGATLLASSEACHNQAFIYGDRVLALQFHLEATPGNVQALLEQCGDEVIAGKYIQTSEEIRGDRQRFTAINKAMDSVLNSLWG